MSKKTHHARKVERVSQVVELIETEANKPKPNWRALVRRGLKVEGVSSETFSQAQLCFMVRTGLRPTELHLYDIARDELQSA